MKSIPALLFSALLFFSLGSCSKEYSFELPTRDTTSGNGNFYATINGQHWEADSLEQAEVDGNGVLTIVGINHQGNAVAMVLPALQVGSYTLEAQSLGYALYANLPDTNNIYLSNSSQDPSQAGGTVVITSVDTVAKTVSGTFQFNLFDISTSKVLTVSAGVFTGISYSGGLPGNPTQPGSGGGSLPDTLEAKVNGTPWLAVQISTVVQLNELPIVGISADMKQSLGIYMRADVTPGSYPMDFNMGTTYAAYFPDIQATSPVVYLPLNSTGKLNIIENDTVKRRIRGNFSFTGQNADLSQSFDITDGYFAVSY